MACTIKARSRVGCSTEKRHGGESEGDEGSCAERVVGGRGRHKEEGDSKEVLKRTMRSETE